MTHRSPLACVIAVALAVTSGWAMPARADDDEDLEFLEIGGLAAFVVVPAVVAGALEAYVQLVPVAALTKAADAFTASPSGETAGALRAARQGYEDTRGWVGPTQLVCLGSIIVIGGGTLLVFAFMGSEE